MQLSWVGDFKQRAFLVGELKQRDDHFEHSQQVGGFVDKLKEGSDNVRDQIDNAGDQIDRFCMAVSLSKPFKLF